jgi:hypothetical protein
MRLFAIAFALSACLTAVSAFADNNEPLTSGSPSERRLEPGWARFQEDPAHTYRVERARERQIYGESLLRYYTAVGYDYSHPVMNAGTFSLPIAQPGRYVYRRGFFVAPGLMY